MGSAGHSRGRIVATVTTTVVLAVVLEIILRLAALFDGHGSPPAEVACARPAADASSGSAARSIRIAVVGESSAAGFSAPMSFAAVVEEGLRHAFPERCVFVRNYAQEGARFHADQAELAKAVLPYFDLLLIYAGNNEVLNAVFAQGNLDVFGLEAIPDQRAASPLTIAHALDELTQTEPAAARLQATSHLLTFAREAVDRLILLSHRVAGRFAAAPDKDKPFHGSAPPATAAKKSVPQEAIDRIADDYAADVAELRAMASRLDKIIVLSTVFTFDTWPPMFSRRGEHLTESQRSAFEPSRGGLPLGPLARGAG